MTYSAPLKATLQLVVFEEVDGQKRPRNIIEKEVYLGELPLLTPLGTFVINGAERVVVSQLHRSPGVVFEEDTHPNGQRLFSARIIPFRGSWVEFTIDIHDVIYVHIDKKKKFPATALLRAFGYGSNADILRLFFAVARSRHHREAREPRRSGARCVGAILAEDIALPARRRPRTRPSSRPRRPAPSASAPRRDARQGRRRADPGAAQRHAPPGREARAACSPATRPSTSATRTDATSAASARRTTCSPFDVADPETGEVLAEAGQALTDTLLKKLPQGRASQGRGAASPRAAPSRTLIKNTLAKDPTALRGRGAGADLRPAPAGRRAQPGDRARSSSQQLFFNPKRYDLGRVGRYKINQRLKLKTPTPNHTVLTEEDFVAIIRYLIDLHDGPRPHRRHRPPRQPPDPLGGRADRQPVLGRPLAHGAPGQGADEHQHRSGEDLARRPGQRPHGVARSSRRSSDRRSCRSSWTRPTRWPS